MSDTRIDMTSLMDQLARHRPIVHSDFQHALAWQLQLENPAGRVRLETRPRRGMRLDLLVSLGDEQIAIEVKYLVARFDGIVLDERFELPNQALAKAGCPRPAHRGIRCASAHV